LAGIKGRSGRRKSVPTLVKEALDINEAKLHIYLERLEVIALNKNASPKDRVEAIEYLINRALGMPKATTDLRVGRLITLTNEDYSEWCRLLDGARGEELKLINQYSGCETPHKTISG